MRRASCLLPLLLATGCYYWPAAEHRRAVCTNDCTAPAIEICNGLDDDGDGQIDEDDPADGTSCDPGGQGMCAAGVMRCIQGVETCDFANATTEACNGRDDDCDGLIDEDDGGFVAACDTGLPGMCAVGSTRCVAGTLTCLAISRGSDAGVCNGLDDDCNGIIDDGCAPELPGTLRPRVGAYTGTPWASQTMGSSLRPTFTWSRSTGATRYELQVDDSCRPGDVPACTFPSPEVDVQIEVPTFTPAEGLPISTTPPVGRFYAWRVRACVSDRCSSWTTARGLHVGQVLDDYDGDGYADLAMGMAGGHGVRVKLRSGIVEAGLGSHGPSDYYSLALAPAGDFDGDGFSDLVVGQALGSQGDSRVIVAFGGRDQQAFSRTSVIDGQSPSFGEAVSGAGDLDGDGFDDVVAGTPDGSGSVTVLFGLKGELASHRQAVVTGTADGENLGLSLARGYLPDGSAAVAVGAPGLLQDQHRGAVLVMGGAGLETPGATYVNPDFGSSSVQFGAVLASTPDGPAGQPAYAVSSRVGDVGSVTWACSDGSCTSVAHGGIGSTLRFLHSGGGPDLLIAGDPAHAPAGGEPAGRVVAVRWIDGNGWRVAFAIDGFSPQGQFGIGLAAGDYLGTGHDGLAVGTGKDLSTVYLYTLDPSGPTLTQSFHILGIGMLLAVLPGWPGTFPI